jgi:hypothetical protein
MARLRIAMLILAMLAACVSSASAVVNRGLPDLDTFLALERLVCPSATVSATFYEWRTTSKYRSVAGLHLGYDIALPGGTPAVAGWPGQVVRIVQWYGPEYGITVLSPSGYETTYGHLSPRVKVGDVLNAGDPVGMVVNDHVDVKMRGPDGVYFDFGHSTPPAVGVFPMPAPIRPTREGAMEAYQAAWYSLEMDKEELKRAQADQVATASELGDLRARVRKARATLPKMKQFLAEGLVARIEVEKAAADAKTGVARVVELERRVRSAQADVAARKERVRGTQVRLEAALSVLRSFGVSMGEIQKKLKAPSSPMVVAQARELKEMRSRTRGPRVDQASLAAARSTARRMEELYAEGVVSRNERDRARARYDAIRKGLQ